MVKLLYANRKELFKLRKKSVYWVKRNLGFSASGIVALFSVTFFLFYNSRYAFPYIRNLQRLSKQEAIAIATEVLDGRVDEAVEFLNYEPRGRFIVALRRPFVEDALADVYVLRKIGSRFVRERKIRPDVDFSGVAFQLSDIQRNGNYSVSFEMSGAGTGGDFRIVSYVFIAPKLFCSIMDRTDTNNLNSFHSSQLEYLGDEDCAKYHSQMETDAVSRGFLGPSFPTPPDMAAEIDWHDRNPLPRRKDWTTRKIEIKYLDFEPPFHNSHDTLQSPKVKWFAVFKGSLWGYDAMRRKYFVAYSAVNKYDWPIELSWKENKLHFGVANSNSRFALAYNSEVGSGVVHRIGKVDPNEVAADLDSDE